MVDSSLPRQFENLLSRYSAASAAHSGRTLREHLIATYELLVAWNNTPAVCYAGLFHSIYGTQVFKHQAASLSARAELQTAIGDEAEALVYQFCFCSRAELLAAAAQPHAEKGGAIITHRIDGSDLVITPVRLASLLEIAVANDIEQIARISSLSRYRHWSRYGRYCLPFLSPLAQQALSNIMKAESREPGFDSVSLPPPSPPTQHEWACQAKPFFRQEPNAFGECLDHITSPLSQPVVMTSSAKAGDLCVTSRLIQRPVSPTCIDDAIPNEIQQGLLKLAPRLQWSYGWTTYENKSARYWHYEIGHGDKRNETCIQKNVEKHPIKVLRDYASWLQSCIIGESIFLRYYLNAHTYGVDGAPHTDSDRPGELTAVTYLTPAWNPQWAGATSIYNSKGDITLAVLPRNNRILVFPSDMLHGPDPLSRFYGGLRIVLVAKYKLV